MGFIVGGITLMLVIIQWGRDISREGAVQGLHTSITELGLRWGMALFIVSEVFFFLSFFLAFFHRRLSPNVEIGRLWPPFGIRVFNPFSGSSVKHNCSYFIWDQSYVGTPRFNRGEFFPNRTGTLNHSHLGVYFTFLQGLEYYEARFSFADGIYGSTFFIATGFHGLHVIVGTIFLAVSLYRHVGREFRSSHHFGFEAAA